MTEKSTLSKISNTFTLENRYKSDFEVIEKIGTGGFASVYRVRNLLDNNQYAIKKIKIPITNSMNKKELENVLNEIRCLAKIKNEHVVNYNYSWIEVKLKKENKHMRRKKEKFQEEKEEDFNEYQDYSNFNSTELEFFEKPQKEKEFKKPKQIKKKKSDLELVINNKMYKSTQIDRIIIYIQMELCKQTLSDFIDQRIKLMPTNTNEIFTFTKSQMIENIKIFHSIVKALVFIHGKNLIHRDLKPGNIFIDEEERIKIGDFGLVANMSGLSSPTKGEINNLNVNNANLTVNDYAMSKKAYLTKNIGTLIYASPEQLSQNFYDHRTDIYSLGLILLELCYPFRTKMEKNTKFAELKSNMQVPELLIKNYPQIAKLIVRMVSSNPKDRPSAQELIKIIENEVSLDFKTEENISPLGDKLEDNFKCPSNTLKIDTFTNRNVNPNPNTSNISIIPSPTYTQSTLCTPKSEKMTIETGYNSEKQCEYPSDLKSELILAPIKSRKRFMSEDLKKVKSYEFVMKRNKNENWQKIWIKILNEKILIFQNPQSSKAHIIYDINECEIRAKIYEEIKIKSDKSDVKSQNDVSINKKYSKSEIYADVSAPLTYYQKSHPSLKSYSSDLNLNSIRNTLLSKTKSQTNYHSEHPQSEKPQSALNYQIVIDHPYLHKCLIKSDSVFETLEFYSHIKELIK